MMHILYHFLCVKPPLKNNCENWIWASGKILLVCTVQRWLSSGLLRPCSLVEVYRRFRGPCCLHHPGRCVSEWVSIHRPDDGGSKDLWNDGKRLPYYTALQPRRQPSSYSPPWEPQILLCTVQSFKSSFEAYRFISFANTQIRMFICDRLCAFSFLCFSVGCPVYRATQPSCSDTNENKADFPCVTCKDKRR
jgi:hypothetical protein